MEDRFHAPSFYYLVMLEVKMGFFVDYFMSPNYRTTGCTESSYFLTSLLFCEKCLKFCPGNSGIYFLQRSSKMRGRICVQDHGSRNRASGSSCRKEGDGEERRVPGAQSRREEGLGYQPAVEMKVKEERGTVVQVGLVSGEISNLNTI